MLLLLSSFSLGCGEVKPRTQVTVVVNADPEVRAVVESLRLEVFGGPRGGDEYPVELSDDLPLASPITWPVTHAVVPRNGDSDRLFRVEATARGRLSSGSTGDVAYARVITGFVDERTLQVELTLYASCLELPLCDQRDFSCEAGGVCLSARREPGVGPGFDGGPRPADAGRDGGVLLDGGQDAGDSSVEDGGPGCAANSDCDDANPCTDDFCTVTGCLQVNNTADCPDGVYCNGAEQCRDGVCVSPGDPCASGTLCDEALDGCSGCITDANCPPPEEVRDLCDYGTEICSNTGTQRVVTTPYECRASVCQPGTSSQTTVVCNRNTDGTVCAAESCEACGRYDAGVERCTPFACQRGGCDAGTPVNRSCSPPISDGGASFDSGDEGGVPPPL